MDLIGDTPKSLQLRFVDIGQVNLLICKFKVNLPEQIVTILFWLN